MSVQTERRSASSRTPRQGDFQALLARTRTIHRPVDPAAYDCVKLVVIRDGSALVYSEFGERFAHVGDVLLLGANVLCGARPEGQVTASIICLDTDYMLDQLFWQYASVLGDRLATSDFANTVYAEPAQLLRIGEDRAGLLMPWLDELVALSVDGKYEQRFHRMQALWYSIVDQVAPFIHISPIRTTPNQRARTKPTLPRDRKYTPLRAEARRARDRIETDIGRPWLLAELAGEAHLSRRQLARVFSEAYGKTPLAYLTMLRVEEMARLLRDTNLSIGEAGRRVGWASRNRAATAFSECTGVTPGRYRAMQQ